ncbi:glycosyltransferase family 2 protein [Paenibacillus taiwanensis]|uniref:glycosyltransferase family 2 protein n=1 Tax=Paenibacillus taiwanensis TaxID=401638 RepID=UPI00041C7DDB|nr:glycosyltransferase [Paenibacillus taiwanensis]
MNISIIIPVHNKVEQLEQTLAFISEQEHRDDLSYEVIVVDDGSTEPVKEVVDSFVSKIKALKYSFIPRDKFSCRSRTRNRGIKESKGNILVFLDCGIVIPAHFVDRVAEQIGSSHNTVLYHYILGAFTDPDKEDMSVLDGITPHNLQEISERLKYHPAWEDMRTSHFHLVNNDLNQMDVPWTMGWSGAISASRDIVVQAGGFDESFKGWGAEDTDFSYQLHKHGAIMRATENICVLHLPHRADDQKQLKIKSSFLNRKKMHVKNYQFDTEIYPYSADMHYDQVISKFNHLVVKYYTPEYELSFIESLNANYITGSECSLIIGEDSIAHLSALHTSHIFIQNKHLHQAYTERFAAREVVYLLGVDTPYARGHFDTIVVTDYYRMFSEPLAGLMFKEWFRISKRLILIYHKEYISYLANVAGWTWHSIDEIELILRSNNLSCEIQDQMGEYIIIEVVKAASKPSIPSSFADPAPVGN